MDDFAEQTALARSALQRAAFEETIERAERLLLLRPAAARLHQLLSVAKAALGRGSAVPATDDASPLVKAALRAALRAQPADHAVCQRLLACVPDHDAERAALAQRVVMLRGVIHQPATVLLHRRSADLVAASADEIVSTDGELAGLSLTEMLSRAKRALRANDGVEAARCTCVAGRLGSVDTAFVARVHKQLLVAGCVDEARQFAKDAPGSDFDRILLTLRQHVAEGQYDLAVNLARQTQADDARRIQLHRTAFLALRSQRRHADALEFGLSCLDVMSEQRSTFGYSVARTASLCDTSPSNIARGLASAYRYADGVENTPRESEDWASLLKFRLLTFDFDAAQSLLLRVQSVSPDEVAVAQRQLDETRAEVIELLPPIASARARLRLFACGKIPTLDTGLDPHACVQIHMPGGWLTHKPRQDRLRIDVRPAFFTLMSRLQQQGIPYELIPQLGANEHVVKPKPGRLSIAYHTICRHPNVINIKGSDLPNYLYFDHAGYAGWSELAIQDELDLSGIDVAQASTFFDAERDRILSGNVSKYPQASMQDPAELPPRYVFVALQTLIDKVQELAYVPMLTMLDWVVERFAGTATKVVVKRHPDCSDARVAQRLRAHIDGGAVIQSNASIHQLIAGCDAVFAVNSGVGCEALLHLKPVYLFGRADYRHVCHQVRDREQFLRLTQPVRPCVPDSTIKRFLYFLRRRHLVNVMDPERLADAIDRLVVRPLRLLAIDLQDGEGHIDPAPRAVGGQASDVRRQPIVVVEYQSGLTPDGRLQTIGRITRTEVALTHVAIWSAGRCDATAPVGGEDDFQLSTSAGTAPQYLWTSCQSDGASLDVFAGEVEVPTLTDTIQPAASQHAPLGLWFVARPDCDGLLKINEPGVTFAANGKPLTLTRCNDGWESDLSAWPADVVVDVLDGTGRCAARIPVLNDPFGCLRAATTALATSTDLDVRLREQTHAQKLQAARVAFTDGRWTLTGQSPDGTALAIGLDELACVSASAGAPSEPVPSPRRAVIAVSEPHDRTAMAALPPLVLASRVARRLPPAKRVFVLAPRKTPTESLYVTAPLERIAAETGLTIRRIETTRQGSIDLFLRSNPRTTDTVIVVRYLSASWLAALLRMPQRPRLVYLIDDDLPSVVDTLGLPSGYRRRMLEVARFDFELLVNACDHLLVSSTGLAQRYASPKTVMMEPCFVRPPKDLSHHDRPGPVTLAYHATASHYDDAAFIAPVLAELLDRHPELHLDLIVASSLPGLPQNHPRVKIQAQMSWDAYVQYAYDNPAHIAIAPLLPTPFNQARSVVKLLDCASLGAAGVFAQHDVYVPHLRTLDNALLTSGDTTIAWLEAMNQLVSDHNLRRSIAITCAHFVKKRFSVANLQELFITLLQY